MAAPKKTTARKPAAKKAPAKTTTPRVPRKTAKIIRNLHGITVNARFGNQKDPFRVTLKPRGANGDTTTIPVTLIDDLTFIRGIDKLWEVITTAEAANLEYAQVGYIPRENVVQVIRPDQNTVLKAADWDGTGKAPRDREQEFPTIKRDSQGHVITERDPSVGTGMHTIDVPGSDTGLHALLAEANKALPPEADFSRQRVVIERVKG